MKLHHAGTELDLIGEEAGTMETKNPECPDIELGLIGEADILEPKNPELNKVIPDLVFTEMNGIKAQEISFSAVVIEEIHDDLTASKTQKKTTPKIQNFSSPVSKDDVLVGVNPNSRVARLTSIITSPHHFELQIEKKAANNTAIPQTSNHHNESQNIENKDNITTTTTTLAAERFENKEKNTATLPALEAEEIEIAEDVEENDFIPVKHKRRGRPKKVRH